MLGTDRDAVVCDLAETYHLFDLYAVSLETLATLCAGLRDDSRIKMKMMDMRRIAPSFSLVHISDTLTMLTHSLAAKEGTPMPELYSDIMTGKQKTKQSKGFYSIEEFEEARRRMIGNG